MQFNASSRGAIIASLMQYLSSFRRLVSAERAVDKSLSSSPSRATSSRLTLSLSLFATISNSHLWLSSDSSNYSFPLCSNQPSCHHHHHWHHPRGSVCAGHFSGAELHPPNCNFVGHHSLVTPALFPPPVVSSPLPLLLHHANNPLGTLCHPPLPHPSIHRRSTSRLDSLSLFTQLALLSNDSTPNERTNEQTNERTNGRKEKKPGFSR